MARSSIFANKGMVKEALMAELKAYRNIGTKLSLILWIVSFTGHYTYTVAMMEALRVQVEESLYNSFQFSLLFALIGYCFGSMLGAQKQRERLGAINRQKEARRRYLEEQIAIRQAKLDAL